jgi:signal transduction histidine kinase
MEAVRRSLDHMQRLVQDLLEVDRIDRGRLSIHEERLAPGSLVEELNGWLGPVVREAGLHWELDIASDLPPIVADHARLIQVLANLVGNAVNATQPGGRVSVRGEHAGTEIRFHVSDTGAGIDPESLPRIFDRFFQIPVRGKTGSGLGLTISRGLVEAHGGRMWAESRLGEGSTFSFSLPLAD